MPCDLPLSAEQREHRKSVCQSYETSACDTTTQFSPQLNGIYHSMRMTAGLLATIVGVQSIRTSKSALAASAAGAFTAACFITFWHGMLLTEMQPGRHRRFRLPLGYGVDVWADNFRRTWWFERSTNECTTTSMLSTTTITLKIPRE